MKNKILKIVAIVITMTMLGTSNSFAGDTYAGQGALIGAASGLGTGATIGFFIGLHEADHCDDSEGLCGLAIIGDPIIGGLIGVIGGTVIGTIIGATIHKNPKVSVAPLFIQSKEQGNTTGGSVAFHF